MDIVMGFTEIDYLQMQSDCRDFSIDVGYHYRICKKWMKKTLLDDRIYFQFDKAIKGYGIAWTWALIDDNIQRKLHGRAWNFVGQRLYTWKKSYWYKTPIEYKKYIAYGNAQYINMKKILNGRPEPSLLSDEQVLQLKKDREKDLTYMGKGLVL